MNEQLKVLLDLQKIDSELYFLQDVRTKKPLELEQERCRQQEAEDLVQRTGAVLTKTRMAADSKELDVKKNEGEIEKAQVALNTARSNEEYQVFKGQIERFQEENGKIEEFVLVDLTTIDSLSAEKQAAEGQVEKVKAELAQKQKDIDAFVAEVDERLVGLKARREEIVAEVGEESLYLYDRVLERYQGSALALAENSVCQGCYMSLTKQTINEIIIGKDLVQCRNCVRILYLKD
jgi:predicted  nucleic acid-binding Zn-ribbon protein